MNAAQNAQRWSIDQQRKARAAAGLPPVEDERMTKLARLRAMLPLLEANPAMASTLDAVKAEIARLKC